MSSTRWELELYILRVDRSDSKPFLWTFFVVESHTFILWGFGVRVAWIAKSSFMAVTFGAYVLCQLDSFLISERIKIHFSRSLSYSDTSCLHTRYSLREICIFGVIS